MARTRFIASLIATLIAAILLLVITYIATVNYRSSGFNSNLPIVLIDTNQQDLTSGQYSEVELSFISNTGGQRNFLRSDIYSYRGRAGVRVLGEQTPEKNSYKIRIREQNNGLLTTSSLGLPEHTDWILTGPYEDQSYMKDVIAYELSNSIGQYAPRTRFVEVLLTQDGDFENEGSYLGLFVLTEEISRGENRVDITRNSDGSDNSYIFNLSTRRRAKTADLPVITSLNTAVHVEYPNRQRVSEDQFNWIESYVDNLELQLLGLTRGNADIYESIDEESLLDWILLNELFANQSVFIEDTVVHKDHDGILKFGPIWRVAEDIHQLEGQDYSGWSTLGTKWMEYFVNDDDLMERLHARWDLLREHNLSEANLRRLIDDNAAKISEAQARDFSRWGMHAEANEFERHTDEFTLWLDNRAKWMDRNIGTLSTLGSDNVPIVMISATEKMFDGDIDAEFQEQNAKTEKVTGRMDIIYNNSDSDYTSNLERYVNNELELHHTGNIGIRLRGFSSAAFSKKSYAIDLRNDDGIETPAGLFQLPSESDWVLYGPFIDKSLIRNSLAYELFRQMGHYAPRTVYVSLYLNQDNSPITRDHYRGLYVFTEKIKSDRDRVDFVGENSLHTILEIGKTRPTDITIETEHRGDLIINFPNADELTEERKEWIQDTILEIETELYSEGVSDKYFDMDSLVDYALINELFKNQDAYEFSTFLQLSPEKNLTWGPVWDFDLTAGITTTDDLGSTDGWTFARGRDWSDRIYQDPDFQLHAQQRWKELRKSVFSDENLSGLIAFHVDQLEKAQVEDNAKWDSGVPAWANLPPYEDSYDAEVDKLEQWLLNRAEWLDSHISEI